MNQLSWDLEKKKHEGDGDSVDGYIIVWEYFFSVKG